MKVISKGVEKEIKILTFFNFDTDEDAMVKYILYTDIQDEGLNLYLATLHQEEENIVFEMPSKDKLMDLRGIIQNLISNNPNTYEFMRKKYKYINVSKLEDKVAEEKEVQKIQINPTQYKNLKDNKCLKYPFKNFPENQGKSKKKLICNIISSVFLLGLLVTLLFMEPDVSQNLFGIEKTCLIISSFQFGSVANYSEITSSTIIHLSLLTLLLAYFSYNNEKNRPIISYFLSFLFLFIFNALYYMHLNLLDISKIGSYINTIKGIAAYALIHALILTICYQAFKGITKTITYAINVRSFILHYAIFLVLFLTGLIGLMLFYDYNLFEPISKFIKTIIVRR